MVLRFFCFEKLHYSCIVWASGKRRKCSEEELRARKCMEWFFFPIFMKLQTDSCRIYSTYLFIFAAERIRILPSYKSDTMDDLLIILLLILLNGIFSMTEVALISARKSKLTSDMKQGSKAAARALQLASEPNRFLSTVQIGITLIGILTGVYSSDALADDFARVLGGVGVPLHYTRILAQTLIVIAVTYLSIVLGELVPKRIGLSIADDVAKLVARPMHILSVLALPFVWVLSKSTSLLVRFLPFKETDSRVTEEEIKSMIQEGTESGEVQEVEQDIMERALVLGDQRVESLMTHRKELVFLEIDMKAEEVESIIRDEVHSAYPVMGDDPEDVRGIVALKDLVLCLWKPDFSLASVLHAPIYFPENMTVYKALEQLKKSKLNRALVCDEFGSLQGIITLKDIMEGLVGSMDNTPGEADIIARSDGQSWLVNGQCLFYDFLAHFDREDLYTTDFNTVGGLILEHLEHIPHEGEKLVWNGFSFEVVDMDGNRIDKLLVKMEPESVEEV